MDYVKNVDPKAFITVYSVKEMRYQPKNKKIKHHDQDVAE